MQRLYAEGSESVDADLVEIAFEVAAVTTLALPWLEKCFRPIAGYLWAKHRHVNPSDAGKTGLESNYRTQRNCSLIQKVLAFLESAGS